VNGPSRETRRRAAEAVAALRALLRAALDECGAPSPPDLQVQTPLYWSPQTTARELADEVIRLAAEHVSRDSAFRNGFVYCYHCGSAACVHARPPAPGAVFSGYESTGRPRWTELFNELLELGDPRTDLLFERRPVVLARVVGRRRLIADQLASFGRNSLTYRIWGQVVAGYFHVDDLRGALTVQIVETRDHRLHLQIIAPADVTDRLAAAEPDRDSSLHRTYDALVRARNEVQAISELWRGGPRRPLRQEVQRRAFATLRHLCHSIERKGRQRERRTAHAEVRAREKRPVHKAREDLQAAGPEDFFWDNVHETIVVLGRNNRLHAFSPEARHITSLFVGRDEIDRRRRRKRYVPLDRAAIDRLRRVALKTEGNDGKDAPPPSPDATETA